MGTIHEDMRVVEITRRIDSGEYRVCMPCEGTGYIGLDQKCERCESTGWIAIAFRQPRETKTRVTTTQMELDGLITALVEIIKREHSDLAELCKLLYANGDGSTVDARVRVAVIRALRLEKE